MKKGKNITLLIGIACILTVVLWKAIEFVFNCSSIIKEDSFKYSMILDKLPILIIFLFLIIPVILLIRNLKNKTGKLIPIISIIVNSIVLFWVFFFSFSPDIPRYITINEFGLIDIYFKIIMQFLESGGLLLVVGYVALIIGSSLSLLKNKQNIINEEGTAITEK